MDTDPSHDEAAQHGLNTLRALGANIPRRLRHAALLEAVNAPDRLVDVAVKTAATGRLTLEALLQLRDQGIEIDGVVQAIRAGDPS